MNAWRAIYAVLLLFFAALPVLFPFLELAHPDAWTWTGDDLARLRLLGLNTLILCGGTAALSLPMGLALATLLFRTHFPGRQLLLRVLLWTLFLPLLVIISNWQAMLGAGGWLPIELWRDTNARPWGTGMGPAIWIHALAAIPWVTLIIGLGMTWVEPELEDEAAQSVGAWRVLLFVTLPRARASFLAALAFVVLQTAGEVSVTDLMQVATLAEELRTQIASGDRAGLPRTLVLHLPSLALGWVGMLLVIGYLQRALPPLTPPGRDLRPLPLGATWSRTFFGTLLVGLLVLPPVSLVWQLGLAGHPPAWNADEASHFLLVELHVFRRQFPGSMIASATAGFLASAAALIGCWLARDRAWFRWLLFSLCTLAWVIPGTLVGIGLNEMLERFAVGPMDVLWLGPSPWPLIWAQVLRTFPIAVLFLWPTVRLIPQALFEDARLSGAGAPGELWHIVMPMTWRGVIVTAVAMSAIGTGEVAASLRVDQPGYESFMKILLEHMHRNFGPNLAALCLWMLACLAGLALVGSMIWKLCRWIMAPPG